MDFDFGRFSKHEEGEEYLLWIFLKIKMKFIFKLRRF